MEKESNTNTVKVEKGIPTHGGKYVQYSVLGNLFEVSSKYAPPIQLVGAGAYGIVWYSLSTLYSIYRCMYMFAYRFV